MSDSTANISPPAISFHPSLDYLKVSNARAIMVMTAVFFTLSAIFLSGSAPTRLMSLLLGLSIAFALTSYAAYRLTETHYIMANIGWQFGLFAIILTSCVVMDIPEILILVSFLPLIAAISLGAGAALAAEGILFGLAVWARTNPGLLILPVEDMPVILILGAFSGLIGWTTTNYWMATTEWALFNFEEMRGKLEMSREQGIELQQAQEDLLKANQELSRLAGRLQILQRVAEEARQAKAEFVANVSHELRTPLNMIIGFTEVIARSPRLYGSRLPAALLTDITAIQRNSHQLLGLVNDILDLSQVEAGRMALNKEWVTVSDMIQEAVQVVQSLFSAKGLYIKLEIAEALPQIFCDQIRIRQVIINLLSNAGRFTVKGGVTITCGLENDSVAIRIIDTGPGIPEEDQKRIFEPFQQVDNSTRRLYGGSGLGLTISKQFVELHHGKMELTSQRNEGTTFLFTLPVMEAVEEAPGQQNVRRSLIPGDAYGYHLRTRLSKAPPLRVLPRFVVLEKEQSLQRLISRYMQDTEVVSAASLPEAVDALNQSPAQALLVNMPPFESLSSELLSIVPFGTPVISCWIPGEVEAASQLGVSQYLMKPLTRERLLDVIENLAGEIAPGGGVKNILVVDDEPDELHLFARMLESASQEYRILQASTGKRALELLHKRKPDLLLLDLIMPVMNGFQVLEEMRNNPDISSIPVIVISSLDPLGEAITSNALRISHNGGFSTSNLLEIIQAVTQILIPAHNEKTHRESAVVP